VENGLVGEVLVGGVVAGCYILDVCEYILKGLLINGCRIEGEGANALVFEI
jgi:hypothetical protein